MKPLDAAAPIPAAARASVGQRIAQAYPPLTPAQALVEAERCYYCHDAPCITACPTGIDVPSFIARIAQGNLRGAAQAILEANPLGGMCARVCPTEVLCEDACVRHTAEDRPVEIGLLQRYATDALFANPGPALFTRKATTGKRIAVVGAGPAGLACAHGLARQGHDVAVFDARRKAGGLNEYGIASYKTTGGFAQREVQWLLSIGGIELRLNQQLGRDITLPGLRADFDAVFLGLGLQDVNALGLGEPEAQGLVDVGDVMNAVDFIEQVRQADDVSGVPAGRHVLVIGGGMTAIDAAVQSKMLGAETVTIAYRRGPDAMPASRKEQQWAQTQGVLIRHWALPEAVLTEGGRVCGVRFAKAAQQDGRLVSTAEHFTLAADRVLRAIGQTYVADDAAGLTLNNGRIATDDEGRTSLPGIWAGGDCRFGGRDLTVEAVEDGKVAARSIHAALTPTPLINQG